MKVLRDNGEFIPKFCVPLQKVAIIVPFRDRERHLKIFLNHIHPILQNQSISYRIFIIEQNQPKIFNKATLMNVGYLEAKKLYNFDCVIFHDVDMLSEDSRNLYNCILAPRHIGSHVDKFGYKIFYPGLVGGCLAFYPHQFELVHGYSTSFYGWGGEDDDMKNR